MLPCRTNRRTNVSFTRVPRPDAFDVSVLEPDLPSFQRALDEIKALFRAFAGNSERFAVTYLDIRPVFGDFKIVHLLTGEESFVEAKTLHCRVEAVGSGTLLLQHSQTCLPDPDRAVFTWRAQWDYLYTHVASDSSSEHALFVPRDKIPKSWWNRPLSEGTVWLDWPVDHPDKFEKYLVNRSSDARLVHDMEKILATNSARAQEPISIASVAAATLTEMDRPETPSFFREERWNTSIYRRGHGSAAHHTLRGDTYHGWASEVLLELCRAR